MCQCVNLAIKLFFKNAILTRLALGMTQLEHHSIVAAFEQFVELKRSATWEALGILDPTWSASSSILCRV